MELKPWSPATPSPLNIRYERSGLVVADAAASTSRRARDVAGINRMQLRKLLILRQASPMTLCRWTRATIPRHLLPRRPVAGRAIPRCRSGDVGRESGRFKDGRRCRRSLSNFSSAVGIKDNVARGIRQINHRRVGRGTGESAALGASLHIVRFDRLRAGSRCHLSLRSASPSRLSQVPPGAHTAESWKRGSYL